VEVHRAGGVVDIACAGSSRPDLYALGGLAEPHGGPVSEPVKRVDPRRFGVTGETR
jgi:hypothetical protein